MRRGRLGQTLRVYWPEDHMRVEGVIDDHDRVDHTTHIYHIVYQDGNEQVAFVRDTRADMPRARAHTHTHTT